MASKENKSKKDSSAKKDKKNAKGSGINEDKSKDTSKSKDKAKDKRKRTISCVLGILLFLLVLCSGIAIGGVGVPKVERWLRDHNFIGEEGSLIPDQKNEDGGNSSEVKKEIVTEENMFIDVVEKVESSVVSIAVEDVAIGKIESDDTVNIGTGFIIDSSGLIMTNQHVVSRAQSKYVVVTPDGTKYEVQDIARDNINDVAILKVDGDDMDALTIGNSQDLQVGQLVVAIGNPLGEFPGSVTTGVVSGLGRSITAQSRGTAHTYENVIQTDAAINPGNSGGPLLDMSGNVVGVNFATTSGADNLSFAIPINSVTERISEYKKYGKFIKPFLGVEYAIITKNQARFYEDIVPGALIRNVVEDSPADKAGIKVEDIITKVEGEDVGTSLYILIQEYEVGQTIEIEIWRDGETITREVTLDEASE